MKLRSVGYGERLIGVSAARLTTSGSRIEYRRSLVGNDSAAGAITEWYVNTAAGLEQGFTLESAPGERRDGERLRVVLALEGDLRAQAVDDGQALEFKDDAGQRVLRYDHLVVRDAGGRELEARMAVRMEGGEGRGLAGSGRPRRRLAGDDRPDLHPAAEAGGLGRGGKLTCSAARWRSAGRRSWSARLAGTAGFRQGSAYVFVRSGGVWSQQQKLAADAASLTSSASRWRSAGRRSWSARRLTMAQRASIKARPMSLCAAVESGASSRNSWPRTRRPGDQFGPSVAISGETIVVGARLMVAQGASDKARPMSLCAAVESGASSRNSWPRTRRIMTCSAPRWRSAERRSWSARRYGGAAG